MSSAHRPTWAPAQGKEGRQNSKVYSARDLAAQTKLKFRQPGQGTTSEVARRDLKLELIAAERDASVRKAKGEKGYVQDQKLLLLKQAQDDKATSEADEQAAKRRKLLQEAADLDKDDSDDNEGETEEGSEGEGGEGKADKGKGKAEESDEDEDSDDSDDDEDETAELLRELEKIKKERAEERERQERERAETEQVSRDEEIATGNPLLNLQAALGHSPAPSTMSSSTSTSGFGVKRRWDDDVIFKGQARGVDEKPENVFVNDLLRSNYHRAFMKKYVQ